MGSFRQFVLNEARQMATVYHVSPKSGMKQLRTVGSNRGLQVVKQNQEGIYVAPTFRDAVAWAVSHVNGKKQGPQKNHSTRMAYRELTIYTLEIPKDVLERSWFSRNWEPEYFITAEDAKLMRIVKEQTFSLQDLFAYEKRDRQKHFEKQFNTHYTVAKQLRNNYAAQVYLTMFDKVQKARTGGWTPTEEQMEQIKRLMSALGQYTVEPDVWTRIKPSAKPFDMNQKGAVDAAAARVDAALRAFISGSAVAQ